MEQINNFINGQIVRPESGKYLPNFEPATGLVYSEVADSDERDIELAVAAAVAAFSGWSRTPRAERSQILNRLAQLIVENLSALAQDESRDSGKPLRLAKDLDIPRSAQNFSFFADWILRENLESFATDSKTVNEVEHSPLGVVACISPWNLPLYLFTWKIAPALAAGNCVVAKPSEVTPMTAFRLAGLCAKAGLPAGVLNIVQGLGPKIGPKLITHPKVRAVSFTGSTRVGREIATQVAPHFKKISLEMGGKNPNLIFADCDFDLAVRETVRAAFLNQGQICLCGSRILVEQSIYEKFKEAFVREALKLRQGDPSDLATDQGAVVSELHFNKIMAAIETARREGGQILIGGKRKEMSGGFSRGWFIEPTIIEGLSHESVTNQEEIFGPVATIAPFSTEEEAVRLANSTRYGLASSIFTKDLQKARRVGRALEAGIVWVNCWMLRDLRTPFGGVKESGVGREGGDYALKFFTEAKNICVREV